MKKLFKKVLALSLCACMVVGMSTGASAYWPGSGPAPQVTKVEKGSGIPDAYGDIQQKIKVTGYGKGTLVVNGSSKREVDYEYFTNFGTVADGCIYTYDCTGLTKGVTYDAVASYTSTNFPYKKVELRFKITA